MPTYLLIDNGTGRVEGTVDTDAILGPIGGLNAPTGKTFIDKAAAPTAKPGDLYDFRTFAVTTPASTERIVTPGRFFDLFARAQRQAIYTLTTTNEDVRDLWTRVQFPDPINLLSPRVAGGLALLKALDVFGKDADTEIARILSNTLPS